MKLIILYNGIAGNEWDEFDGDLDAAIAHVKSESRYINYGHEGALIVLADYLYSIDPDGIETRGLGGLETLMEQVQAEGEPDRLRAHPNLTQEQIAWINAGCPEPEP